ncbi:PLP-dependent transferase [Limosilactobacillus fastidiosus]|uniref:PLP-dependent transferase n=1 Tax=Limosilactobacillus fastidiosus TaxID=2759855 RepID=UPI001E3AB7B9|nr:PLP-dependent transferase [Limosilactobacillus fastidiosus]MCD7114898.1 PLP-dependent transferase [Limosilactobacillus fastidiosus]MCD7116884.1 PLP-dependent transferase [Limosilactobacillus fastidiosus]
MINFLQGDSRIANIYYPELIDFPGHDIAAKQTRNFGAMISFELKPELKILKILSLI